MSAFFIAYSASAIHHGRFPQQESLVFLLVSKTPFSERMEKLCNPIVENVEHMIFFFWMGWGEL